jgi:hypothetical protein
MLNALLLSAKGKQHGKTVWLSVSKAYDNVNRWELFRLLDEEAQNATREKSKFFTNWTDKDIV